MTANRSIFYGNFQPIAQCLQRRTFSPIGKDIKQLQSILNKTRKMAVREFCRMKNEELHKNAAKRKPLPNKGVS